MGAKSETQENQHRHFLVERGRRFYEEKLKSLLEPEHIGRFVAIDPESGRYFLHDNGTAALIEAHSAMPTSLFYLARVGYSAADTVSGYGSRSRVSTSASPNRVSLLSDF